MELMLLIVLIGILVLMLLPMFVSQPRHHGWNCANNLKQVGLAFRIWAGDLGRGHSCPPNVVARPKRTGMSALQTVGIDTNGKIPAPLVAKRRLLLS
jgi:hypothetical protein